MIKKIIYILLLFMLLLSVIKVGYGYMYDTDELMHAYKVYLLAAGLKPYTGVFTIFSPLFHYLLLPVFLLVGFSFETLKVVRLIMIVIFIVRYLVSIFIVDRIFGRKVVYFFAPLFLLDYEAVFAGMQIRPDNLALFLFTLGLAFLILSRYFIAGIIFSLSFLTLIKVAPGIVAVYLVFLVFSLRRNEWRPFLSMLNGLLLPLCLFFGFYLINGVLAQMIKQVFIYPLSILNNLSYAVPFGYFFRPDDHYYLWQFGNRFLFTSIVMVPYIAIGGILLWVRSEWKKQFNKKYAFARYMLLLVLIAQIAVLFTVKPVFIQYYLPFTWLMMVFGAVFFQQVVEISRLKPLKIFLFVIISLFLLGAGRESRGVNEYRSGQGPTETVNRYRYLWSVIPANETVYPGLLFRPAAVPLICCSVPGANLPPVVFKEFVPAVQVLMVKKVKYVYLSDQDLKQLSSDTVSYIENNYQKSAIDPNLRIKN